MTSGLRECVIQTEKRICDNHELKQSILDKYSERIYSSQLSEHIGTEGIQIIGERIEQHKATQNFTVCQWHKISSYATVIAICLYMYVANGLGYVLIAHEASKNRISSNRTYFLHASGWLLLQALTLIIRGQRSPVIERACGRRVYTVAQKYYT